MWLPVIRATHCGSSAASAPAASPPSARLRDGVSRKEARAELETINRAPGQRRIPRPTAAWCRRVATHSEINSGADAAAHLGLAVGRSLVRLAHCVRQSSPTSRWCERSAGGASSPPGWRSARAGAHVVGQIGDRERPADRDRGGAGLVDHEVDASRQWVAVTASRYQSSDYTIDAAARSPTCWRCRSRRPCCCRSRRSSGSVSSA